MKWFVHIDQPYYPYAEVVEADTAGDALDLVVDRGGLARSQYKDETAFFVVPYEAGTVSGAQWRVEDWTES
jgi:hypothetical protein